MIYGKADGSDLFIAQPCQSTEIKSPIPDLTSDIINIA